MRASTENGSPSLTRRAGSTTASGGAPPRPSRKGRPYHLQETGRPYQFTSGERRRSRVPLSGAGRVRIPVLSTSPLILQPVVTARKYRSTNMTKLYAVQVI